MKVNIKKVLTATLVVCMIIGMMPGMALTAHAADTIGSVAITMPEAVGETLNKDSVKIPAGETAYYIENIEEITVNGVNYLDSGKVLADADKVEVKVRVTRIGTAEFDTSAVVTVNGNFVDANVSSRSFKVIYKFTVGGGGSGIINSMTITMPEAAGETLNKNSIKAQAGQTAYDVESVQRIAVNGTNYLDSGKVLANADVVEVKFYVRARGDASFDTDASVSVNGKAINPVVYPLGFYITYTFNVGNSDLSSISVTFSEEAGEKLNSDALKTPSDSIYRWGQKFELNVNGYVASYHTLNDGDQVTVTFGLETLNNRTIPDDVEVKVNGKPATVTRHNGTWIIVSYVFTVNEAPPANLWGDADGSGTVDSIDAMLALRLSVSMIDGSQADTEVMDVNGDGNIDSIDAMLILRHSVNLLEKFPVE